MVVVTIHPDVASRYYAPQITAEGQQVEVTGEFLVVFAPHGPVDVRGGRRSVLVVPLADVLAVDQIPGAGGGRDPGRHVR